MGTNTDFLIIKDNMVMRKLRGPKNCFSLLALPSHPLEIRDWEEDMYGDPVMFIYAKDLKPLVSDEDNQIPTEILDLPDDTRVGLLWW